MKKALSALLCVALLAALTGCGDKPLLQSPAEAAGADYMEDIRQGKGLAEYLLTDKGEDGMMEEVMESIEYKVVSEEKQEDGTIVCLLEIRTINMEEMLDYLPDDLESKEDAREEMLDRANDADRSTYEAKLVLVPDGDKNYEIQVGNDFVNAITGGMLDLIIEAFELEVEE